jgi:Rrf2 family protein
MFRLNRKTEYALMALQYLQRLPAGIRTSSRTVAKNCDISEGLLAKILQELRHEGLISSTRGAQGGYALAVNLSDFSFQWFLERFEGQVHLVDCAQTETCEKLGSCGLKGPMLAVNDALRNCLNSLSLETVLDPASIPMIRLAGTQHIG